MTDTKLDPLLLVAALHPPGSIFHVCAFGDGGSVWFDFAESPEDGLKLALATDALAQHHGVYACVGNQGRKPAKGRGTEADVACVLAVWCEEDAASFHPLADRIEIVKARGAKAGQAKEAAWRQATPEEREAAKAAALAKIDALPIGPPSALVNSGRGWHAYWLLSAPATNLDLVRAVNKRIAKLANGDKCWDLTRVLKIPGTHNRKDPEHPVEAVLVRFDGEKRHNLESLAKRLGIPDAATENDPARPETTGDDGARSEPPPPKQDLSPLERRLASARARAYADHVPGAVAGERGHDRTFALALALVRGFALDVSTAGDILREWNSRCSPPWTEKELSHKLDDATASTLPLGYMFEDDEKNESEPELAAARASFSSSAVDTMVSVEAIYAQDALEALALLRRDDPGFFAAAKAAFTTKFPRTFRVRDFDRAIASATARPDHKGEESPLDSLGVPDLPPGLATPSGWTCVPHGVRRILPDERTSIVTDTPLLVAGRSVDLADGDELLDVVWLRQGVHRRKIPRSTLADRRKIVELAAHGFPVHSGNALDVVCYLAAFEAENLARLPVSLTTSVMGWQKDRNGRPLGFMAGKTLVPAHEGDTVEFLGADLGDDQLAAAVSAKGSLEAWKEAVAPLAAYPKVAVGVYAALATPLLAALHAPNFILDWSSGTSTGKTTALRIAASVWGSPNPGGLIRGWDSTRVFVERMATLFNHLPIFLDDTARAKTPEDAATLAYLLSSGIAKGRGSIHSIQRFLSFHGVTLSTGEQAITDLTNDSGTKARTISLRGSPFGSTGPEQAAAISSVVQAIADNHGTAGPAFAKWILAHADDVQNWRAERQEAAARYASQGTGTKAAVTGRLAEHLATIAVTAKLAHLALDLPWHSGTVEDVLQNVIDAASTGAEEADIAEEALTYVASWVNANKTSFWQRGVTTIQPNSGWAGVFIEDQTKETSTVCILPHVLDRILDQAHFPIKAMLRSWRDRGIVISDAKDRSTTKARLDGERTRVVAFRWLSIFEKAD